MSDRSICAACGAATAYGGCRCPLSPMTRNEKTYGCPACGGPGAECITCGAIAPTPAPDRVSTLEAKVADLERRHRLSGENLRDITIGLESEVEPLRAENARLKEENAALRAEVEAARRDGGT